MSKHGPHPLEWLSKGLLKRVSRGTSKISWKAAAKGFLFFFFLSVCSFFGERWAEYLFIGK